MIRRIRTASWLVLLVHSCFLSAQGTKLWLQSHYAEFEKGRPQNVAIDSDGYLEAAPALRQVLLTPSTYVWTVATDSRGNAYLGTGSPATVLKVTPQGSVTKLFSTRDLSVQAVQVGADGSVYAATLPGGKVYRISPNQSGLDENTAAVVFDPAAVSAKTDEQPKYIWALAFDARGALYIAAGEPASIYRVTSPEQKSKPERFFSSDEQHIRCLLFEPDGNLVAGTDGSGLVYRIAKDGKGIVIYDAPKREVTALAESPDGRLYIGSVGDKTKNSLPPLPVQGRVTATITIVVPGSVQAAGSNSLALQGSEIDELDAQGAPRKLWESPDDVLYALDETPQGLLAATGNDGKIYRISEDRSFTDLARAEAGQATAFAKAPGGTYVVTGNSGKLYELGDRPASESSYVSDVFDSGVFSTWGRAEVNAEDGGPSGPFDLYVRSGNVESPERNWNPWQKVEPNGPATPVPAARFLQWKAVLHAGARIASVGINYLPVNVAPVVDEIAVQPGARVNRAAIQPSEPQPVNINLPSSDPGNSYVSDPGASSLAGYKDRTAVTVRWSAHDDNGDNLLFDIYFRGDGEKNWRLLKARVRDRFYTFDSILLPDGGYRVKVVASDAPSHPAGDALTGDRVSEHFVIDTTPPAVDSLLAHIANGQVHVTFDAKDATSPISRAEYSFDAGRWQYLEPVGRISDSLIEHYDFSIPLRPQTAAESLAGAPSVIDPGEHVLAIRVYDRYGNAVAAKVLVRQP